MLYLTQQVLLRYDLLFRRILVETWMNKNNKMCKLFLPLSDGNSQQDNHKLYHREREGEIQFCKSGFVRANAGDRIHLVLLDSS